ncbi:tail fiber domain-containing protein [Streptococcus oralis]|uniref:tail fiber domain-containing protein n=1 Tax=Streptococcus oralis TaxID=1303 RepID=UPI001D0776C5|nr:tail fiber domain-containing protein [Streptococcus oralis]MCB7107592.1 tail fiber domain-containing protein [Streptococcus oralis]
MDIFRRRKFDEAMFAKNRTLAIRVGRYQSSDIKEAHFDYGYIKGDTYKPGGTCAGSGKIIFSSIITTFNKLDKVYPEIGLLVDGTYEWVKMGEYFINDIEIDRNRNTTKLDLMDGMFKLNREHITSLTYPAEIRQVIKEICLKTGVELANENMNITSMNYQIEKIPSEKKMTFRDVLSLATQMLGMSCFFNREGKLEIKELTDSGITITADSYFMHGLTKSEVQYQIAGITCKKDKETLTVGMRTGRSLELDNLFMSQSILDNLYHKIKDIRYYPFNLNYQGHLLLDVGQWVTIKTNKGETFKSPVLSQSFTFKGGLRGRISADSKAGNDAQYSYAGTLTKKIEQFSEFEKQIQNQIEEADKGHDQKVEKLKNDFNDQVELAKAKAEEVKRSLTETIDQRFRDFDSAGLREARQKADEALSKVGANTLLAQEAKQISEQVRRQLDNKADLVEFQRVKETNQLYERIIGSSESDIAEKVSRMAMTSQLFQVEVAKSVGDSRNYVKNADFRDGSKNWKESNISGLNFNYEHSTKNRGKTGVHIYGTSINARYFGLQQTFKIELRKSDKITLSFLVSKDGYNTFSGLDVGLHYRKDGAIKSQAWKEISNSDITASTYKKLSFNYELPVDIDEINLMFYGNPGKSINLYISEVKLETGSKATPFTLAPEDTDEAVRTVQNQLAGSWAVQNLTSAGSIVSQINVTNNQILIEAEKIRLKGKTLLDELTAIDGYFKRLFVGEGAFAKLNAEVIGSKTITADKLIMDSAMARLFVSSDIFTDTLASKAAFITKLRSVVVSATLLEGYKGKIGGFQIGTHDKDPSTYWLTGQNQFYVGMSNGAGNWGKTALWVNWGTTWDAPGNYAWFVKESGEMFCYNRAYFWNTPVVNGDLRVTGNIYYNNENSGKSGYWIYSSKYSNFEPSDNYLYLYYSGSGYDWIPMNKEISDRRYKSNIEASTVSGLDVIEQLKTYSYRKEYDGKIEDIACGIMAQDVQKYAPEAFFENPDGAYSYRTFELVPYLIKAIQELNQKIQKLEKTA